MPAPPRCSANCRPEPYPGPVADSWPPEYCPGRRSRRPSPPSGHWSQTPDVAQWLHLRGIVPNNRRCP
ncbi:MAG: hypothetical protein C4297_12090 [Gemmataceae bacterium]